MKYYTEPSREIPVAAETEVLVVGGGPAGFGAALHAARMGRKTMLIEQYGAVGGVATTGIMSHWTGRQDGGCFEELREKARDCEAEQVINPEKLRILMLDMLMEAGVNVQLYTGFSDVIMEGNRVAGVITESKSGREAILSKMVIDSTGDGDVAARAGVPFEKGRSTDGGMQPMTIMFKVAGVDMDAGRRSANTRSSGITLSGRSYPAVSFVAPRRCHSQHEQYDRCGRHKCKRSESC